MSSPARSIQVLAPLAALACALGCAASGAPGVPSSTSVPLAVPTAPVQAASAASFVDSVGLNVHFAYYGTVYTTQSAQLVENIAQLGVHHLRDQMAWEGTDVAASPFYTIHNTLARMGLKTDYILTAIDYPISQVAAYPALVNDMEAAEPANEWDVSGDPNWVAEITAQQRALYAQLKSTPATAAMTVVAPSLAMSYQSNLLGNVSGIADAGNSHAYFAGWNPGNSGTNGANNPTTFLNWAGVNNPNQKIWVTETGFWSQQAMYWGGAGNGEALMATYAPRALLEFWNAGAGRSYLYDLADSMPTDLFGLLRADGSIRPAFYAISNLLALLNDPGGAFTPGSLSLALTGATDNIHHLLLEKSDGDFFLALWVETPGMNTSTLADIPVPNQSVVLNLARPPVAVTAYQWDSTGSVTASTLPAAQAVPLSIGPNITILRLQ